MWFHAHPRLFVILNDSNINIVQYVSTILVNINWFQYLIKMFNLSKIEYYLKTIFKHEYTIVYLHLCPYIKRCCNWWCLNLLLMIETNEKNDKYRTLNIINESIYI